MTAALPARRVEAYYRQLLTLLAKEADKTVRRRQLVPSKTLLRAMHTEVDVEARRAYLVMPHYWALYVHDGAESPMTTPTSRRKRNFVFFRRKADDPRLKGLKTGSPIRLTQLRPLTKNEYTLGLLRNRMRRKRNQPPYMYVLKLIPAPFRKPGVGFFDVNRGMRRFSAVVDRSVFDLTNKFVRSMSIGDEARVTIEL